MKETAPISKPQPVRQLIMVEGRDDAAFMRALCAKTELDRSFVHDVNGKGNFSRAVASLAGGMEISPLQSELKRVAPAVLHAHQLSHLLLVSDADDSAEKTFRDLQKALKRYRDSQGLLLSLPSKPLEWSGIDGAYGLRTGIVILPIDKQDGALEDLMLGVIKPEMLSCIDGFRKCLSLPDKFTGKQVMQLYLGASADDGRRFADSFGKEDDFWDLKADAFTPLVTFLQQAAT